MSAVYCVIGDKRDEDKNKANIRTFSFNVASGCTSFGVQRGKIQGNVNSDIAQKAQTAGGLTVHYLDVGQGNAILLQSEGQTMLIDGGARKSSSFVVSYLEKQKIEKLDYVLISHFDEDHLSGAVGALHKFPVGTLITPDYEADSNIFSLIRKSQRKRISGSSSQARTGVFLGKCEISNYFPGVLWS